MNPAETRSVEAAELTPNYIYWAPIVGGAVVAAALAFVLHSFGAAIGISVSSTAPTWRDASVALWLLTGVYLILVAIVSYGAGGYLAGRCRSKLSPATSDEIEFRDGTHGLLAWAVATLITGVLALAAAQALTRVAARASGASGPAASVGGENIIAFDLDKLFRTDRRPDDVDMTYTRAEASRILLTAAGHSGLSADDRRYLVRLTARDTGLSAADAERRVDSVVASARNNIARARRSAVIIGFMAGAAAVLGAAAAWFAACAGGRHRDGALPAPSLFWQRREFGRAPK
jgi:hypothetical protein